MSCIPACSRVRASAGADAAAAREQPQRRQQAIAETPRPTATAAAPAAAASAPPPQLGPGLFPDGSGGSAPAAGAGAGPAAPTDKVRDATCQEGSATPSATPSTTPGSSAPSRTRSETSQDSEEREDQNEFSMDETVFVFDWDDTVLPSSWVQSQGLRLDDSSRVSPWQREQLATVAHIAAQTLQKAKQHGTVVLVTNAQRGWIELSCAKFMPTLAPLLEDLKLVSARTTYESLQVASPLEWKIHAFEDEIHGIYGHSRMTSSMARKNCLSLGDSLHEREALLKVTGKLSSCRAKSLKFVERPDISQLCEQHSLVVSCFDKIIHHDGDLDLCIRCA